MKTKSSSLKLVTWNVNGIRAVSKTHFHNWFRDEAADIVCIQETKAHPDQLDETLRHPEGYYSYWHSAQKAGYSGVAIYSKKELSRLRIGLGVHDIDCEGRVLMADLDDFTLINAYFPNSQRDHARLPYKIEFCKKILQLCDELKDQGKNIILCGDFNIAHKEIDLKNPKTNVKNAGFLPDERAWMDHFLKRGYTDAFRHFVKDPDHYTWWSYRPGVRQRNIGWRLDYFVVNSELTERLSGVQLQPHIMGSDHCPVILNFQGS